MDPDHPQNTFQRLTFIDEPARNRCCMTSLSGPRARIRLYQTRLWKYQNNVNFDTDELKLSLRDIDFSAVVGGGVKSENGGY